MTRSRELRTEAIGAAYDRYAASLFRYAVVMLGDPSAAADAVHRTAMVLERMLLSLPAEQREVVHLKIFEGMTFQEIADAIGESINTNCEPISLRDREDARHAAGGKSGVDEIEDLLSRYRPVGPPPELRARLTSGNRTDHARGSFARWVLVAVMFLSAVLFHALAAREHQRMMTRIPPPPAADLARETFEEPWR